MTNEVSKETSVIGKGNCHGHLKIRIENIIYFNQSIS